MAECETMKVKIKGNAKAGEVVINASDFDPDLHTKATAKKKAAAKKAD